MPRIPLRLLALLLGASTALAQGPQPGGTSRLSGGGPGHVGEPISLSVRNADLQDVLRIIARTAGLNLVVDDDLVGLAVTLELNEVPWDQALELVLRTHGLGAEWNGNVLQVASTGELVRSHQQRAQLREAREQSGGLVAVARTLSWANAADAERLVRSELSPRGRVTLDRRTNTLLIVDAAPIVRRIAGLLDAADPPAGEARAAARTGARRAGTRTRDAGERPAAAWSLWRLESSAPLLPSLAGGSRQARPVPGTAAHLGWAPLDPEALAAAESQLDRLASAGSLSVRSARPLALAAGGEQSVELGAGAGAVWLDLTLEADGGELVLAFRARRASGRRLPLGWHGPRDSGWLVELETEPGAGTHALLVVPEP